MLDILNGKIVAKTEEGCFEITAIDAHRAITVHLLELMEDNSPEHIRENYVKAWKLYSIGKLIYKDPTISERRVREDLLPLMDCLVQDIAERHLAYIVMRYITREYSYRIREKHEINSLYDFFYALRDPVYTTVLKNKPEFELFYRLDTAFYDELGEPNTPLIDLQCRPAKDDYKYIRNDNLAFNKAVKNNEPLPIIDSKREYEKVIPDIIRLPDTIAEWAVDLRMHDLISKDDYAEIKKYRSLEDSAYSSVADDSIHCVDDTYKYRYRQRENLEQVYNDAKQAGCYNICYYIALRIGSDILRKHIAKLSGVKTKIYSDHNSIRRFIISLCKTSLIVLALFIGYKILKAIYDFVALPIFFWPFVILLGGLFSTPESRETEALFSTTSPYKQARLEQAHRQEKQLKELNDNLRRYNSNLNASNNGYRRFR